MVRALLAYILLLTAACQSPQNPAQSQASPSHKGPALALSCGDLPEPACDVFNRVNSERTQRNLPPLELLSTCQKAAQAHADDMAENNYFSHDGQSETWQQRMRRFGLLSGEAVAENIAKGQPAEGTVSTWMNSSGHRQNILNPDHSTTGIGYSKDDQGRSIWVQCFSSSKI